MTEITAEEILLVLNEMEPVDIAEIVVVTHGADARFDVPRQQMVPVDSPYFWPFQQGEILLLDDSGREPLGAGRKPGKWDVHVETCGSFAEAVQLSETVKAAQPKYTRELWAGKAAS